MGRKVIRKIERFLRRAVLEKLVTLDDRSIRVEDYENIEAFIADPNNTFLVSFPRTGSHWLRMLMELYFERPSLVRVFYYPDRTDYLTLHTHDLDLDIERSQVIYLYRTPVETIYSQLQYHEEDIDDFKRITHWADLYGHHLDKWLHRETFTNRKTIVSYEGLKGDIVGEFRKVCEHFDIALDVERLEKVVKRVSKDQVKEKASHDSHVMNLSQTYEEERERFRKEHGEFVWEIVLDGREYLRQYFWDSGY